MRFQVVLKAFQEVLGDLSGFQSRLEGVSGGFRGLQEPSKGVPGGFRRFRNISNYFGGSQGHSKKLRDFQEHFNGFLGV